MVRLNLWSTSKRRTKSSMTLGSSVGSGRLIGYLFTNGTRQPQRYEKDYNVWTEVRTSAPPSKRTDPWVKITLGVATDIAPNGGVDFYPVDSNGARSDRGLSGTVTLAADVANTLLGLGLMAYTTAGIANGTGEMIATVAFVATVAAPAIPDPADPKTTIGNVGATAIRVLIGAPLNFATPVAVTMTANYTRLANFPLPIGTSPGAILNGTTPSFFKPEADALVAAGAGNYA